MLQLFFQLSFPITGVSLNQSSLSVLSIATCDDGFNPANVQYLGLLQLLTERSVSLTIVHPSDAFNH